MKMTKNRQTHTLLWKERRVKIPFVPLEKSVAECHGQSRQISERKTEEIYRKIQLAKRKSEPSLIYI